MLEFNRKPFNFLPLNGGELFDLTCEYSISILERLDKQFQELLLKTERITRNLPTPNFSELYRDSFNSIDGIINDYSSLVKCIKLSLGEDVGKIKSKHTIFQRFSYAPDNELQYLILHRFRNTSQHFAERLQDYQILIDPFLQLSYSGQLVNWQINFGNGGYRNSGQGTPGKETFDSENLFFQSYREESKTIIKETIRVNGIWRDILEINKLLEENLVDVIKQKNICCPPPRNVGAFVTRDQ